MVDNFPDVQLLVTGSSSFDLRNKLNEPLTGRKFEYDLYPLSTKEILDSEGLVALKQQFDFRLIYGSYPEVVTHPQYAPELISEIEDSYLYKDVLSLESMRRPELLNKILMALAHQVGSEVSYNEIAQLVGSDNKTVEKYINLLEKCFVIFKLHALSRNMRNEIKRGKKILFYDNGVRNAVIGNFSSLEFRNDHGQLWENFFISERIKFNHYRGHRANMYFWRNKAQREIDLIEEHDGRMTLFEMKWNPKKKSSFPAAFLESYEVEATHVVTPENYLEFLV